MSTTSTAVPPDPEVSTVAGTQPLMSAAAELLEQARETTKSTTAHMSLVDRSSPEPIHFVSAGAGRDIYQSAPAHFKERMAMEALKNKRPTFQGDVHRAEEWQKARQAAEASNDRAYLDHLNSYRSEMVVPLLDSKSFGLGCVNLHHPQLDYYKKDDLERIHGITTALSCAVENAIQYAHDRQRTGWGEGLILRTVRMVSILRVPLNDRESLFDSATRYALSLGYAECAGLWLLHAPTQEWHLASLALAAPELPGQVSSYRTPLTTGIRGHVLKTREPYYCPNTKTDGLWHRCVVGVRSGYTVPLALDGQVFGVLCLDSYRVDAFDAQLRQALDLYARVLLCALLGNKCRSLRGQVDAHRLELIKALTREDLCRRAVDAACAVVGAEAASLFLRPPGGDGSRIQLAATTGLAPEPESSSEPYAAGEGITGWVYATRVPLRLRNCGDPSELRRWDSDEKLQWRGKTKEIPSRKGFERPLLAVPVLDAAGDCLGVLRASGKADGLEFREEDKYALEQLARVIAGGLAEDSRSPAHWSGYASVLDYLRALLRSCQEGCGAAAATLDLVHAGRLNNVAHFGPLAVAPGVLTRSLQANSVCGLCATSGQVQSVSDVGSKTWKNIYQPCFAGTRSELAVPVTVGGKVVAVINLEAAERGHFRPEDQARAEKCAALAALALTVHSVEAVLRLAATKTAGPPDPAPGAAGGRDPALEAFRRDLPGLMAQFPGKWVAYHGPEQVGIAPRKSILYQQCLQQAIPPEELLVRCIEGELREISVGPELADEFG